MVVTTEKKNGFPGKLFFPVVTNTFLALGFAHCTVGEVDG